MAKKPATRTGARTTSRSRKTPAANISSTIPAVRVRMYRQGLGDCFLITFDAGGDERHMLIDFGTLGTSATNVRMPDVIEDIAKSSGRKLQVLVATHAHQDHVSGFLSQQGALEKFDIQNVWMPWTEDPADTLAKQLGNKAKAMRAAIASAFAMPQAEASGLREKLAGIAGFEGGDVDGQTLAMGDSIARALDVVRNFKGAKTTYHSPGPPAIELPEIPGFRFYVLGPPRDAAKLQNMQDNAGDELYGLASAVTAHAAGGLDVTCDDDEAPFDQRFCYPVAQADQFFPDYGRSDQKYRRIDDQWLRAVAELAAKLDDFRNNTSLALAIERIGDGRVLLFPADAQEGNWLSWHDPAMEWKVKDAAGATQTVKAADLLLSTVFYKVGHHSSHNATARGKGLEIMRKNKELTAFIPVDRGIALHRSPPGSWRMPAVALFRELLEACQGRVVRADLGWATDAKSAANPTVEKELLGLATTEEWLRWKASQDATKNVAVGELSVEYLLK